MSDTGGILPHDLRDLSSADLCAYAAGPELVTVGPAGTEVWLNASILRPPAARGEAFRIED